MARQQNVNGEITRRHLLGGAAAGGLVFGLGSWSLDGLIRRASAAALDSTDAGDLGYGPLRPMTRRDPETGYEHELLLPEGFDFAIFGMAGTTMSDGHITPLAHDGMAAFAGPNGTYRLVRNHEVQGSSNPSGHEADRYDTHGGGGTSTLQVRFKRRRIELEKAWLSLAGTIVNCAGGPTPWGSWLSCEESTEGLAAGFEQPHGYVFEVPSSSDRPVEPKPLRALGRFAHEAVAVDPRTSIVYLTEDNGAAGFYRFVPDRHSDLTAGRLQMLKVAGEEGYFTGVGQQQGVKLPATWVDIADPDPAMVDPRSLAVYAQGAAQGAATFVRLEGCWWGEQAVYFTSTNGGDRAQGQIWKYRPGEGEDTGALTLVYEPADSDVMSMPDNITVTPQGSLIVCEDSDLRSLDEQPFQQLVGVTVGGTAFPFCVEPTGQSKWAGATFSPDGNVLFANLQTPGLTIAFWGPWAQGPL